MDERRPLYSFEGPEPGTRGSIRKPLLIVLSFFVAIAAAAFAISGYRSELQTSVSGQPVPHPGVSPWTMGFDHGRQTGNCVEPSGVPNLADWELGCASGVRSRNK